MPWTGMRSSPSGRAAAVVAAGRRAMALNDSAVIATRIQADSLRQWHTSAAYGRHRPKNRCAAARERPPLVQGHRRARALSAPAVKRRVDRLERDGVIRGYTAIVDPRAFGWHTEAFVDLYCEGRMPAEAIKRAVEGEPGVVSAHTVAGEASAMLHVMARGHAGPRAVPRADPRHGRHQPDGDRGRALDPVRALADRSRGARDSSVAGRLAPRSRRPRRDSTSASPAVSSSPKSCGRGVVAVLAVRGCFAQVALGRLEAFLDALAALDHRTRRLVDGVTLLVLVLGPAPADAAGLGGGGVLLLARPADRRASLRSSSCAAGTGPSAGRIAQGQIRAVHDEVESARAVAALELSRPASRRRGWTARSRLDQADHVPRAELVVGPCARGARRLGRKALAPVLARDRPARPPVPGQSGG